MEGQEQSVKELEAALSAAIGRIKALEYAIRVLITTSPNPEQFEATWQQLLPKIADVHTEYPSYSNQLLQAGLQDGLALVTETARIAVAGPLAPRS